MALERLTIGGFRNLRDGLLPVFGRVNAIIGPNASGKTSLLEAIHVLARARSFRAARLDSVTCQSRDGFRLVAEVAAGGSRHRLGLERDRRRLRVRVDGQDVRVLSELARHLPVQVVNTESQRLLQDGPGLRRQFLNWTTFHVEHRYREAWKRFERVLRQRNAAIRGGERRLALAWNGELINAGEQVTAMRSRLLQDLEPLLEPFLKDWLGGVTVALRYRRGWAKDVSYGEALRRSQETEMERGFTLVGPHRADLAIKANGVPAQEWLSRGQQKILVIGLMLAVTNRLQQLGGGDPILLVDDLASELDAERRLQVVEALLSTGAQVFLTAAAQEELPLGADARWFHVEHGELREMVQ
ncbi:DNA replication/repair protein RecF [Methylonatrum kenyense]|uniref:DNA replication/repair protein RecF n=1 Tax=Methylonatrum kenyense TaxID=455253 RepID=UPI0020C01BD1|nr:DNA replication/repair protein RecF [Methylonatrum kenyense]MCK8515261.1 DNA replication/repair protein RecF [Methylonatrum kenyense]